MLKYGECVVKTPFTTHGSIYRGRIYCATLIKVLKRIKRLAKLSNYVSEDRRSSPTPTIRIPYLMIQPRVVDNTEYKILVVNGEAKLITTKASGFITPINEIFTFAERVTKQLKERYPETMTEYIMRVDMFEVNGKLKVNEFESFDADFLMVCGSSKRKFTDENEVVRDWSDDKSKTFILEFWIAKFHELIRIRLALVAYSS